MSEVERSLTEKSVKSVEEVEKSVKSVGEVEMSMEGEGEDEERGCLVLVVVVVDVL